jgi:hypothetical protein
MHNILWRLNDAGDKRHNEIYWELVFKIIDSTTDFVNAINEKSVFITFSNNNLIEKWQMCISNKPNPVQPKDMPWWNKTLIDYNGVKKVYKIVNNNNLPKLKKEFGDLLKNIFSNSDKVDHNGTIQIINNIINIELN